MNKILAYVDDAMSNFTFITWYYTYQWRFSVDLLIMKKMVNVYVDYFRPIIIFKVDVKTITIPLAQTLCIQQRKMVGCIHRSTETSRGFQMHSKHWKNISSSTSSDRTINQTPTPQLIYNNYTIYISLYLTGIYTPIAYSHLVGGLTKPEHRIGEHYNPYLRHKK